MKADKFFEAAAAMISSADLGDIDATFQFEISSGNETSIWAIDVPNKKIVKDGVPEPSCTFGLSDEAFVQLLTKQAQPAELFMSGKLKLEFSFFCFSLFCF